MCVCMRMPSDRSVPVRGSRMSDSVSRRNNEMRREQERAAREREREMVVHTHALTSYPSRAARCSRVSPAFLLTISRRASGGMGLLTGISADTGGAGVTGGTGTSGTAHGRVGGAVGW